MNAHGMGYLTPVILVLLSSVPVFSQSDEITTTGQTPTFKVQTTLVEVPVVVRDRAGDAVGNLRQEDFHLFDKGKRQEITKFSVQKRTAVVTPEARARSTPPPAVTAGRSAPQILPLHFIALLFDDVHIRFADLPQVRDAVRRYLSSSLQPGDRVALYTTSGKIARDFTGEPGTLEQPLLQIAPNPIHPSALASCLYISYYQAVQIDQQVSLNPREDDMARSIPLSAAYWDTVRCIGGGDAQGPAAGMLFRDTVQEINAAYYSGEQESRATLAALSNLVRRMALLPGERTIILASPGFFVSFNLEKQASDLTAQAIRSKVLINTVGVRGVWTSSAFEASQSGGAPPPDVTLFHDIDGEVATGELIDLAEDTGGTANLNNDFDGAIRKAAATPEYIYVLGFAPQNLKFDGSFHSLKVTVTAPGKLTLQARRGYWAPQQAEDELAVSRQEIEDAVFSRDEIHDLAVDMHTQVINPGGQAKLNVLASVDLKALHLRKVEDRSRNDVTIVAALFDTNGNFIAGAEKIVQLRLRDETVRGLDDRPPFVVVTDFPVKPGAYLVRMVARDAEGRQLTAENAAVDVP
ncbi:MAG TPA: VWA domain-containing protein [Bryobacteraceae bacterium]|nr:VWA domain-containing protein [Bryobacteraceae bacterium]